MTPITIKDVAARAGVSAKTVSRVINNEAHVRPEVRDHVKHVVAEMGYRPNAFARGLSSSRAFLVGLFFDDPASGYAADVQRGAFARCRSLGYHLVVEQVDPGQAGWRDRLDETLRDLRFAGAILTPPICDSLELMDVLEANDIPIARIAPGEDLLRTAAVRMDDRKAARDMTDYLLSLGHRDIAFIKGKPHHSATARRLEGFHDAMRGAGLIPNASRVLDGDFSFRSGLDAAEQLLTNEPQPTAVFASNDEMALGMLVGAMRHQVAVPAALSVVGFDDAAIARMSWPQLTTIRQPNVEMGAAAVDMVNELALRDADDIKALNLELPFELLRRESTGPATPGSSR